MVSVRKNEIFLLFIPVTLKVKLRSRSLVQMEYFGHVYRPCKFDTNILYDAQIMALLIFFTFMTPKVKVIGRPRSLVQMKDVGVVNLSCKFGTKILYDA